MRRNSMLMALAAAAMLGVAGGPEQRPQQPIKGRPNRRGKTEGKVELQGKKADFVIIDDIPPARTRAVVSPHPATKPKKQSESLKRMLKGKRR